MKKRNNELKTKQHLTRGLAVAIAGLGASPILTHAEEAEETIDISTKISTENGDSTIVDDGKLEEVDQTEDNKDVENDKETEAEVENDKETEDDENKEAEDDKDKETEDDKEDKEDEAEDDKDKETEDDKEDKEDEDKEDDEDKEAEDAEDKEDEDKEDDEDKETEDDEDKEDEDKEDDEDKEAEEDEDKEDEEDEEDDEEHKQYSGDILDYRNPQNKEDKADLTKLKIRKINSVDEFITYRSFLDEINKERKEDNLKPYVVLPMLDAEEDEELLEDIKENKDEYVIFKDIVLFDGIAEVLLTFGEGEDVKETKIPILNPLNIEFNEVEIKKGQKMIDPKKMIKKATFKDKDITSIVQVNHDKTKIKEGDIVKEDFEIVFKINKSDLEDLMEEKYTDERFAMLQRTIEKDLLLQVKAVGTPELILDVKENITVPFNKKIDENKFRENILKAGINIDKDLDLSKLVKIEGLDKVDTSKADTEFDITFVLSADSLKGTPLEVLINDDLKPVKIARKVKVSDQDLELEVKDFIKLGIGEKFDKKEAVITAKVNGEDVKEGKHLVIEDNVDTKKEGTYEIKVTLIGQGDKPKKVEKIVKVFVVDDIIFNLTEEEITVEKGGKFVPSMDYVKEAEKGEKDLMNYVSMSGKVDTDKVGKQSIIYTLNYAGVTKELELVVNVVEGVEFIVPEEIFVIKGDKFTPSSKDVVAEINGEDLSEKVVMTHDVNTEKVGEYKITYTLEHEGQKYTRETKVQVIDGVEFTVPEKIEVELNSDFEPTLDGVKAVLGNKDALGRVTYKHDVDTSKPGEYTLSYFLDLGGDNFIEKKTKVIVLKEGEKPTVVPEEDDGHIKPDGVTPEDEIIYEEVVTDETPVNEVVKTGQGEINKKAMKIATVTAPAMIFGLLTALKKKED